MAVSARCSESLIGSLCNEASALRSRGGQLQSTLRRCLDRALRERLGRELELIEARRREVRHLALSWQQRNGDHGSPALEPLSVAFLLEISSRPLASAA